MAKPTVTFMCSECGGESLRWAGQCPHCRAWNTLQEFQVRKAPAGRSGRAQGGSSGRSQAAEPRGSRPVALSEIESEAAPRRPLAWGELNRVLGGGIVPGSIVLVGGEPGVGKSTLLVHAAQQIAAAGGTVLYASGEESPQQIRMRASRLGSLSAGILLLAQNQLHAVCGSIRPAAAPPGRADAIPTGPDARSARGARQLHPRL